MKILHSRHGENPDHVRLHVSSGEYPNRRTLLIAVFEDCSYGFQKRYLRYEELWGTPPHMDSEYDVDDWLRQQVEAHPDLRQMIENTLTQQPVENW